MAKKIKIISAFETTDGKIFTDENEAKMHQMDITIKLQLDDFVSKYCYNDMDTDDIISMIIKNHVELISIFANNKLE